MDNNLVRVIAGARTGASPAHLDPRHCVILVPFSTHIVPACEQGLIELQRRGYEVWRVGGYANIDIGRSEMAAKALEAGFEETFWIDSDIQFEPEAVDRIRSHGLPLCCGIYARKGARAIAAHTLPGTTQLGMGKGTGLVELLYCGTGFLHVRREVYAAMQQKLALPLCNAQFGRPMVPYFMPMIVPWNRSQESEVRSQEPHTVGSGLCAVPTTASAHAQPPSPRPSPGGRGGAYWYLGEDYSFCERARQCGFKIMADTSIRLWHIGQYAFGWEDAGQDRPRHDSFLFLLGDGEKK